MVSFVRTSFLNHQRGVLNTSWGGLILLRVEKHVDRLEKKLRKEHYRIGY